MTTERPERGALRPCLGVPVNEGDIVDDFELLDQHGQSVTLNDLVEAGPVVMFFYPKAMTLVEPWRAAISAIWPPSSLNSERHEWESALIRWIGRRNSMTRTALASRCSATRPQVHKQFGTKRMGPLSGKRATFVIDTDRRLVR